MFEIIGQLLCGWLLVDLLTGIIHWWLDQADVNIPVIGPRVILANQEHHDDPIDFTRATLLKRNYALWITVMLVGALWLLLLGPSWVLLAAFVGGIISGEVHVINHTVKDPPLWLRVLWGTGLIQSPAVHARHHRAPYKSNFCVLTNWWNPLLDGLGVWPK